MSPRSIKTKFTYKFMKTLKRLNQKNKTPNHQTIKLASDWSLASAVGPQRAWSRAVIQRIRRRKRGYRGLARGREGERNNFKGSKTDKLRGVVPGGEEMDVCKLLSETAHYIKCLTTQVNVMENIAELLSS